MTKEDLKQFLLGSIPDAKPASGGKQIVCRCRFPGCTDTKRHMYIGPFTKSDEGIRYNCFKCPASGYLNENFLAVYGINNSVGMEVIKANRGPKYRQYSSGKDRVYYATNKQITSCSLSEQKLRYINERLGLSLSYKDCIDMKIVLNLVDIIRDNNIRSLTRHPDIVKQLNDSFIGFLSRTNCTLNMRNLNEGHVYESIDRKYVNYRLFDDDPKYDFYIVPSNINLDDHVKVYIAEGPFDILSVYYNLISDKTNSFFVAGRGKAYYSVVEYLLTTYGIYNMEIHYYVDRDVSDKEIIDIIRFFDPYRVIDENGENVGIRFYVHRNGYGDEKDFGVPKSRIIDKYRRVI